MVGLRPGRWIVAPTDGGATWAEQGNGQLNSIGVSDIAFHPSEPDRMWIATGDGDFGDTRSIGVWTSDDGGASWSATALDWGPYMGRTLTRILVHPEQPDTLWTASSLGIYRSANGGASWTRTQAGDYASLEIDPANPEHLLAGSFGNVVAQSFDGGVSWTTDFLGGTTYGLSRITLAFSPTAPDTVYALAGKVSNQVLGCGAAQRWHQTPRLLDGEGPNLGWTVRAAMQADSGDPLRSIG